mmetsp:Transcript_4926/g.9883  ORF Transcript_4926/g.9883 Transcript_4926/m.9883 type:complete len:143 (+) Transcript_4926:494-922(+)
MALSAITGMIATSSGASRCNLAVAQMILDICCGIMLSALSTTISARIGKTISSWLRGDCIAAQLHNMIASSCWLKAAAQKFTISSIGGISLFIGGKPTRKAAVDQKMFATVRGSTVLVLINTWSKTLINAGADEALEIKEVI